MFDQVTKLTPTQPPAVFLLQDWMKNRDVFTSELASESKLLNLFIRILTCVTHHSLLNIPVAVSHPQMNANTKCVRQRKQCKMGKYCTSTRFSKLQRSSKDKPLAKCDPKRNG